MKIGPEVEAKARQFLAMRPPALDTHLGIEFLELSKDSVVGAMPVDQRTQQPFGILHGGASVALAETLASIGAWLNIDDARENAVGLEINANHLRGVSNGSVTGEAHPIHRGRSTHVWAITIKESATGKPVCVARCTIAIVPRER